MSLIPAGPRQVNFGHSSIFKRGNNVVTVISPGEHLELQTGKRVPIANLLP